MGSGKGSPEYWIALIQPGRILYEMKGVTESIAKEAFRNASYKMPIKTQFLTAEVSPPGPLWGRPEGAPSPSATKPINVGSASVSLPLLK
jgi:hypothetical protein